MEPSIIGEQSLADFWEAFPDELSCVRYLFDRRWPEGFVCRCGGTRHAPLNSRAYTYECLDCGHQTSITAGTVMHRSHLSLTKWFSAAYLIAIHNRSVSARQLQMRLHIAYQTAFLLKRKLQLAEILVNHEPLEGVVEVAQAEICLEVYSRIFRRVMPDKIVVIIALEVSGCEPAESNSPSAPRFNRIRLSRLPDDSAASIEPFIREHVKRGTILLTEDLDCFLGLLDSGYDLKDFGETLPQAQHVFRALENWCRAQAPPRSDRTIEERLKGFVAQANWRVSLDRVLQLALRQQPTSYWDIVGRDNPRKGTPTARRNPRHRKTATGMRQDGSGST